MLDKIAFYPKLKDTGRIANSQEIFQLLSSQKFSYSQKLKSPYNNNIQENIWIYFE